MTYLEEIAFLINQVLTQELPKRNIPNYSINCDYSLEQTERKIKINLEISSDNNNKKKKFTVIVIAEQEK